jgi:hypothetical protein
MSIIRLTLAGIVAFLPAASFANARLVRTCRLIGTREAIVSIGPVKKFGSSSRDDEQARLRSSG